MEMDMVSKAFEQAFVSVSQKLLGLQLQRRKQDNGIFTGLRMGAFNFASS